MSSPLAIHEEHGEVVGTWHALGYREETVVCFDRHLDLKPLSESATRQVRDARDEAALRCLNRPLPVREAPGAYGLDDFLAVGPILGAVRALWWVMPGVWPDDELRVSVALRAVGRISAEVDTLARTRVVDGVLCTRLCGLDIQVHSIETLRARGVPEHARVDVDLDWFADGGAPPDHTVADFADLLDVLGCTSRLDSLTWSVRSGFLSESMRWVAPQLAEVAGRTLAPVSWDSAWLVPARTLAALRGTVADGARAALRAELAPLGAVGVALDGCLDVRQGAIAAAEAAYWRAAEGGVRSSWLAHGIGIARRPADPGRALEWFDRATGAGTDTLEVHAATLAALCLWRLGKAEEAADRVRALAARLPLHRALARIGTLVATDEVDRARFAAGEQAIDALTKTRSS